MRWIFPTAHREPPPSTEADDAEDFAVCIDAVFLAATDLLCGRFLGSHALRARHIWHFMTIVNNSLLRVITDLPSDLAELHPTTTGRSTFSARPGRSPPVTKAHRTAILLDHLSGSFTCNLKHTGINESIPLSRRNVLFPIVGPGIPVAHSKVEIQVPPPSPPSCVLCDAHSAPSLSGCCPVQLRTMVLSISSTTVTAATLTHAVSYSEVASVTLLTWDFFITLSDEIDLVWKQRWTPAKALYLLARYLPWIFQLALLAINTDGTTGLIFTLDQCRKWMIFQAIILQMVVTTVDIILMIRVFALYNNSRILVVSLSTAFICEISYLSYNLATVTPKLGFAEDCFVRSSPPSFIIYWIVSLAFETVLFVLTLAKFFAAVKDGWGKRPVMREFVQDGTWAYALVFVTMAINSALYKSVHSPLAGICFTWLLSVLSFSGSRLILNPRRRRTNQDTSADGISGGGVGIPLTPISFQPTSQLSAFSPPMSPRNFARQALARSRPSSLVSQRYNHHAWDRVSSLSEFRELQPVQIRVEVERAQDGLSYAEGADSVSENCVQVEFDPTDSFTRLSKRDTDEVGMTV